MSFRSFFRKLDPLNSERVPQRAADGIAVGAYGYAARPGPHGIDELGKRFVETHGGNDAAFGWLLWRLHRLEDNEP